MQKERKVVLMSTPIQANSQFQMFLRIFRQSFGIRRPEDVQTEQQEIVAESVRIDAIVVFPDGFDFKELLDRILPFLGKYNVLEYKGETDPLLVGQFYQYSFVELGLMAVRHLSEERTDRAGRRWISQRSATQLWRELQSQGAQHSACTVILSTTDPQRLRQECGFEQVTDYPHLDGALYRVVMSENRFIGSIATYLIVLNHLPVCAINAPLLLLAKGNKQIEFCRWLLEDGDGLTLEERQLYEFYLVQYELIQDQEVMQEMRYELFGPPKFEWIFEEIEKKPADVQQRFFQLALQKILEGTSPENARKLFKTPEQRRALIELLQQEDSESPEE
jgi:hypothetical protein